MLSKYSTLLIMITHITFIFFCHLNHHRIANKVIYSLVKFFFFWLCPQHMEYGSSKSRDQTHAAAVTQAAVVTMPNP